MAKTTFFVALTALAVGGSAAVMAEQHFSRMGAAGQSANHPAAFMRDMCGDNTGDPTKPHLPADVAKMLELTSAQEADINRLGAEACATMTRLHDQMASVLTPEQLSKLHELHGGGHQLSGLHAWLYKLHGH